MQKTHSKNETWQRGFQKEVSTIFLPLILINIFFKCRRQLLMGLPCGLLPCKLCKIFFFFVSFFFFSQHFFYLSLFLTTTFFPVGNINSSKDSCLVLLCDQFYLSYKEYSQLSMESDSLFWSSLFRGIREEPF